MRDRCTKAHEYVFLFAKSERYYYDAEAVSEPMSGKPHAPGNKCSTDGGHMRNDFGTDDMQRVWGASGRRNRRSVWTVTTKPYSGAHFAVMPADLVEPCIKAGCPEQCCPVCGKGWDRVVERKRPPIECYTNSNKPDAIKPCAVGGGMGQKLNDWYKANPPVQLGWQPACDCAASGTIPGTVLDPFAGSGTTLAVAAELGRNAIGCELNPDYIKLAEERIAKVKAKWPLFVA